MPQITHDQSNPLSPVLADTPATQTLSYCVSSLSKALEKLQEARPEEVSDYIEQLKQIMLDRAQDIPAAPAIEPEPDVGAAVKEAWASLSRLFDAFRSSSSLSPSSAIPEALLAVAPHLTELANDHMFYLLTCRRLAITETRD
ncbi:hypothetical protein VKT23_019032 [Stygiomarasmius scandens]|uniref:Uncharacterized protein n=1 Tax=Marasmiellus scandens TaxID=2682957 RepID=A0ABR1IP27_9AGAR